MKEIQVSKFQSSIVFPIPINKGTCYFELGFPNENGELRKLAYYYLNLGYRINKVIKYFTNDNWFDSKAKIDNVFYDKVYQLSINTRIGGSENISNKKS